MDGRVIRMIADYYKDDLNNPIGIDDVYIVWKCKTLQNWKYMLSTTVPDTRYFEVTYNGDNDEFYLDAYIKECNKCIK